MSPRAQNRSHSLVDLACGKREVEDGSPDTVTPITPTDSGFTNRNFICDGGVYFNRSIDSILRLGPDLPRIVYFGS